MGVNWYGSQFMLEVEQAVEKGLDQLANDIVKAAQESMRQGKHGRDYRKAWRQEGKKKAPKGQNAKGPRNVSSAPGEAPAVQYGRLIGSVAFERPRRLLRRVGTNLDYGRFLELGTKRIQPRPWLRPAYKQFTGRDADVYFEGKLK